MAARAERILILINEGEDCLASLYHHYVRLADTSVSGAGSQGQNSGHVRASSSQGSVEFTNERPQSVQGLPEPIPWLRSLRSLRRTAMEKFPDLEAIKQDKEFEVVHSNVYGTFSDLEKIVKTFQRVQTFYDAACEEIGTTAQQVFQLNMSTNYGLTLPFCELLAVLFKVAHLMRRINDNGSLYLVTALYSAVYYEVQHSQFSDFKTLSNLLVALQPGASSALRKKLQPSSSFLAELLIQIRREISVCESCLDLKTELVFDPIGWIGSSAALSGANTQALIGKGVSGGDDLVAVENGELYRLLGHYHKIMEWSSIILLLCPEDLRGRQLQPVWEAVLRDGYILPLYRDLAIYIHEEWRLWFSDINNSHSSSYNPQLVTELKSLASGRGDESKMGKDRIKSLEKKAVRDSGIVHRARRTALLVDAQRMLALLRECPGLLGPKFSIILALVSCMRGEAEWFFWHYSRPPKKDGGLFGGGGAMNIYRSANFEDTNIAEFVGVLASLTDVIRQHASIVHAYHAKYLHGALTKALKTAVEQMHGAKHLTNNWFTTMEAILKDLNQVDTVWDEVKQHGKQLGEDNPLYAARINWLRIISTVFSSQAIELLKKDSSGTTPPLLKVLLRGNRTLLAHSRRLDDLEGLLTEHATLQQLWWSRNALQDIFQEALLGTEQAVAPHHVVHMMRVFGDAYLNARPSMPDELYQLGNSAVDLVKRGWMSILTATIRHNVTELARWVGHHDSKVDLEMSLRRFMAHEKVRIARKKQSSTDASDADLSGIKGETRRELKELGMNPGDESKPGLGEGLGPLSLKEQESAQTEGLVAMCLTHRCLSSVISAVRNMGDIIIFNTLIRPLECVRVELAKSYKEALQELQTLAASSPAHGGLPGAPTAHHQVLARAYKSGDAIFTEMNPPRQTKGAVRLYTVVMQYSVGWGTELSDLIRDVYMHEIVGWIPGGVSGQGGSHTRNHTRAHTRTRSLLGSRLAQYGDTKQSNKSEGQDDVTSTAGGLASNESHGFAVSTLLLPTPSTSRAELDSQVLGNSFAVHTAQQLCNFIEQDVGVRPHTRFNNRNRSVVGQAKALFSDATQAYVASPFIFTKSSQMFTAESTLVLSKTELDAMGALLGVRGWRVVSSALLGLIGDCLLEIGDFLATNAGAIQKIAASSGHGHTFEATIKSIGDRSIERLFSLCVSIGHALTIRRIIAQSVAKSISTGIGCSGALRGAYGAIGVSLAAALQSNNPTASIETLLGQTCANDRNVYAPLGAAMHEGPLSGYMGILHPMSKLSTEHESNESATTKQIDTSDTLRLLQDLAIVSGGIGIALGSQPGTLPDVALENVLSDAISGTKHDESETTPVAPIDLWVLLPVALGICTASTHIWKNVQYSARLQSFSNNGHVLAATMHHLIHGIYTVVPSNARQAAASVGFGIRDQQTHELWITDCLKLTVESMLYVMANASRDTPTHSMPLMLFQMTNYGGYFSRDKIAKLIPTSLLNVSVCHSHVCERGIPRNAQSEASHKFSNVRHLEEAGALQNVMHLSEAHALARRPSSQSFSGVPSTAAGTSR